MNVLFPNQISTSRPMRNGTEHRKSTNATETQRGINSVCLSVYATNKHRSNCLLELFGIQEPQPLSVLELIGDRSTPFAHFRMISFVRPVRPDLILAHNASLACLSWWGLGKHKWYGRDKCSMDLVSFILICEMAVTYMRLHATELSYPTSGSK